MKTPWWLFFTAVCCLFVASTFFDVKRHDWASTVIDALLALAWFIGAHSEWERERK